jgi:CDP-glycerol glycerophosphotransferase (TagB/SpsB family)
VVAERLLGVLRGKWASRRIRPALRLLCEAVLHITPPARQCTVFGWPDREGNGVEVLRALADAYPGRIFWLRSTPDSDLGWLFEPQQLARIEIVPRSSRRALVGFLRSEAVFFTHGIYDRPRFGKRRTFVNLWHGDGPKSMVGDPDARHAMPASVVVSGTEYWGQDKARHFKLSRSQVLVTGNPRIDEFGRPPSDERLAAIGIDPDRPLICWAPTYRAYRGETALSWTPDGLLPAADAEARIHEVAKAAERREVQLVVKPHPLDKEHFESLGVRLLVDAELDQAEITLYGLLARCAGLITDYSSIWTDFLVLDRPIGFYCPDLHMYVESRGLNIDLQAIAPGPFLNDESDFERFFGMVAAGEDLDRERRAACMREVGSVQSLGATERLMREVELLRGRVGLPSLSQPDSPVSRR